MKDFLLRVRVVVRISKMKISRRLELKSVPHVQHDNFNFLIQPIKSLISGDVVAVAVVIS